MSDFKSDEQAPFAFQQCFVHELMNSLSITTLNELDIHLNLLMRPTLKPRNYFEQFSSGIWAGFLVGNTVSASPTFPPFWF